MSLYTMLFSLILFVTSLHSGALRGHLHIFYVCEASHCSGSTTVYFSKLLSMFIWVVFHFASLNKIYHALDICVKLYPVVELQGQCCTFSLTGEGPVLPKAGVPIPV